MVDFGQTRTYLFGGSSSEHKNVMAPYLLHFQALRDAQSQGLKFYDFWGIETAGGDSPGFARFKLGFAPRSSSESAIPQLGSAFASGQVEYGGAYDLVLRRFWYKAYSLLRMFYNLRKKLF